MAIDLQKMKQRLLEKQAELQAQINNQTEAYPTPDPTEPDEDPQDFEEQAVDATEMEEEQAVIVNARALLTEVQEALKRIEAGTYGLCVGCSQPIPEKRLEAIPWASRCAKDEEELEKRNLSVEETYDTNTY